MIQAVFLQRNAIVFCLKNWMNRHKMVNVSFVIAAVFATMIVVVAVIYHKIQCHYLQMYQCFAVINMFSLVLVAPLFFFNFLGFFWF